MAKHLEEPETGGVYDPALAPSSVVFAALVALASAVACSDATRLAGDGTSEADAVEVDLGPPVPDVGTGWEDSVEPWVAPPRTGRDCRWHNYSFDLWADTERVYAMYLLHGGDMEEVRRLDIAMNGGVGWTPWASGICPCHTPRYLAGAIGELLVVAGLTFGSGSSIGSLLGVSPGGIGSLVECDAPPVANAFVVSDTLAYATTVPADGVPVLRFDGEAWSVMPGPPVPSDFPLPLLWADEDDLFVAGGGGTMVSREGTGWRVHDLGTTSGVASLWGFDGDDVWAGTWDGALHHFDGTTWSEVTWPNAAEIENPCDAEPHAALGLWGSEGVLYISAGDTLFEHAGPDLMGAPVGSGDAIVRYDGEFRVIGHWPPTSRAACEDDGVRIWRVRGTSPDDVFVIAEGRLEPATACKRPFILRWDGLSFRWI